MIQGPMRKSPVERFFDYTFPEPNSGCWIWVGGISSRGYGGFWLNPKTVRSHRFAYEAFVEEIPKDKIILHKCDNKLCCNPDHLKIGTHDDNMLDMVHKNRQATWKKKALKLTPQDVKFIRNDPRSANRLSKILGVNRRTVDRVRNGQFWASI